MSKFTTNNLCLDIGGSNTRVALICNGKIIKLEKFPTFKDPKQNFTQITHTVKHWEFNKIGISTAGPISNELIYGKLPNLPKWNGFELKRVFPNNIPLVVENDANCAARYEHQDAVGSTLFVTVSTGIGGGFIHEGKLFKGVSGNELELHKYRVENGVGIETVASGTGIYNQAKFAGLAVKSTKEVFELADSNSVARQIIENAANNLSLMIANIIALLNPSKLVIGGSVVTNNQRFYELIKNQILCLIEGTLVIRQPSEPDYNTLLGINKLLEEI